mmetsp:Transcript_30165/g.49244  ORF Transcript_30165/g.49244 Transcript_30165/m.49244 type:complete len:323 (+) Transcript_30165:832-1800(+)
MEQGLELVRRVEEAELSQGLLELLVADCSVLVGVHVIEHGFHSFLVKTITNSFAQSDNQVCTHFSCACHHFFQCVSKNFRVHTCHCCKHCFTLVHAGGDQQGGQGERRHHKDEEQRADFGVLKGQAQAGKVAPDQAKVEALEEEDDVICLLEKPNTFERESKFQLQRCKAICIQCFAEAPFLFTLLLLLLGLSSKSPHNFLFNVDHSLEGVPMGAVVAVVAMMMRMPVVPVPVMGVAAAAAAHAQLGLQLLRLYHALGHGQPLLGQVLHHFFEDWVIETEPIKIQFVKLKKFSKLDCSASSSSPFPFQNSDFSKLVSRTKGP